MNLTKEGRKTIKSNRQRIKEINKQIEGRGVKILAQYAVLGSYDFINILDVQDDRAIGRVIEKLARAGIFQTTTMTVLNYNESLEELWRRANSLLYLR